MSFSAVQYHTSVSKMPSNRNRRAFYRRSYPFTSTDFPLSVPRSALSRQASLQGYRFGQHIVSTKKSVHFPRRARHSTACGTFINSCATYYHGIQYSLIACRRGFAHGGATVGAPVINGMADLRWHGGQRREYRRWKRGRGKWRRTASRDGVYLTR